MWRDIPQIVNSGMGSGIRGKQGGTVYYMVFSSVWSFLLFILCL